MKKYLYIVALVVPCLLQAAVRGVGGNESAMSFGSQYQPMSGAQFKGARVPFEPAQKAGLPSGIKNVKSGTSTQKSSGQAYPNYLMNGMME